MNQVDEMVDIIECVLETQRRESDLVLLCGDFNVNCNEMKQVKFVYLER
jgi:hypothetical protein